MSQLRSLVQLFWEISDETREQAGVEWILEKVRRLILLRGAKFVERNIVSLARLATLQQSLSKVRFDENCSAEILSALQEGGEHQLYVFGSPLTVWNTPFRHNEVFSKFYAREEAKPHYAIPAVWLRVKDLLPLRRKLSQKEFQLVVCKYVEDVLQRLPKYTLSFKRIIASLALIMDYRGLQAVDSMSLHVVMTDLAQILRAYSPIYFQIVICYKVDWAKEMAWTLMQNFLDWDKSCEVQFLVVENDEHLKRKLLHAWYVSIVVI